MPSGVGQLREVIAFDRRLTVDDGFGNSVAGFVEQFTAPAVTTPLKGSEAVIASRLTGVQPYTITVRYSPQTILVDTDWRARDTRTGAIYDITTVAARSRRDYIDMTCVQGKAA